MEFPQAIDRAIVRRFSLYQEGIKKYQDADHVNTRNEMPVVWSKGSASLVDYSERRGGYPLFIIPSLVNRYYILDLMQENSFLRWLTRGGWAPYVMDWGQPGLAESDFGLEKYIIHYLQPALKEVKDQSSRKPIVVGYCMGGTLAIALAVLSQSIIRSLVLIASPWDFHEGQDDRAIQQGKWLQCILPMVQAIGHLPSEILQGLFASLDPTLSLRKFSNFRSLDEKTQQGKTFIALEDWLNDGVSLTQKVAEECLSGWYGENLTEKGLWSIAGEAITLDKVLLPTLSVVSDNDRIVPKPSSLAATRVIVNSTVMRTSLGHIGMMASRGAQSKFWTPASDWMKQIVA
ncbi:alpha/beta fold hydrolase [Kiloniella sp. EL199]|uniref:alpha/beta fold hydrolase n=1 Tax=Kiloniella sp. EL199 TaxID=2107581 RepID=UPI0013C4C890|nr:alpha/beta fold hydrolase [Kiloniella sp. EL199]